MEHLIIGAAIETILSIVTPIVIVGTFIARYLWKKEKYFTLMKQKMDDFSISETRSHNTHKILHEKINELGNRIISLEVKMDLIIKQFK